MALSESAADERRKILKIPGQLTSVGATIRLAERMAAGDVQPPSEFTAAARDLGAAGVRPVASADDLAQAQAAVRRVRIDPAVAAYIVDIARATRDSPSLSLGVSPRGATALMGTARAWAWLSGRDFVTPDDVKALAHGTLAHRLSLRPEAELEGVGVGSVLSSALGAVPVPR
mgnify:CR=1 FL=1